MQELSFAGCPRMGTLRESQLDRIIRIVTQFFSPLWSK